MLVQDCHRQKQHPVVIAQLVSVTLIQLKEKLHSCTSWFSTIEQSSMHTANPTPSVSID